MIFLYLKKCQILILFAILCAPVSKRGDSGVGIRVGTLIACYSLDSLQNVIFVFLLFETCIHDLTIKKVKFLTNTRFYLRF